MRILSLKLGVPAFFLKGMCMKTIIAAVDFSGISINAALYAADMALALNAKLFLFHSVKDDSGIEAGSAKAEKLQYEIEQKTAGKIAVQFAIVTGFMEDELVQVCNMLKPMAVVMATHGEKRRGQIFFDSATFFFSRYLEYPVINVPKQAKFQRIQKILLATDGKNIGAIPVEKVKDIAQAFDATVDIVHVFQNENALKKRQPNIEAWIGQLKGVRAFVYYLRHCNVYNAITGFAKANGSQLLLAFPGKHSWFHNSETKKLLFNAPVAIMTIQ
jgi:nucleotide-binding universal stress UspA family protein